MASFNPDRCGPYQLGKPIGAGGQGNIFLAEGPSGPVVVKMARREADREAVSREARALRRLADAPGVVRLVEASEDGAWNALERAHGLSIDKWAMNAEMSEIVAAASRLVDALVACHEAGVLHGDLKPSNVMVDVDGELRLLDFGCAALDEDAPSGFRGTPGYSAPEVFRGERATAATDGYGLGGVLYAALAGRPPFVAPDPTALAYLPMVTVPEPVSSGRAGIPQPLAQVVGALLARDPSRRPDLGAVRDALSRCEGAPAALPVVGMRHEREELRRAVVGAADGECRVVVVYGPAGSGRRTLIAEAAECARREGIQTLAVDPKDAVASLRKHRRPAVVALRASQPGALDAVRALQDAAVPALVLVHGDRPVPSLGAQALHLTPPPLTLEDATLWMHAMDGDAVTDEEIATWWRDSFGHPLSLLGRWRASRGRGGAEADLPNPSRRVLQAVRRAQEITVAELARQLASGEHEVLDFCDVLFAQGLIEPTLNGAAIRASDAFRRETEVPE